MEGYETSLLVVEFLGLALRRLRRRPPTRWRVVTLGKVDRGILERVFLILIWTFDLKLLTSPSLMCVIGLLTVGPRYLSLLHLNITRHTPWLQAVNVWALVQWACALNPFYTFFSSYTPCLLCIFPYIFYVIFFFCQDFLFFLVVKMHFDIKDWKSCHD